MIIARSLKCVLFFNKGTIFVGDYWGHVIRVDIRDNRIERKRIASNGISALCASKDSLVACSYSGSVYCLDPATLEKVDEMQAMTQVRFPNFPPAPLDEARLAAVSETLGHDSSVTFREPRELLRNV